MGDFDSFKRTFPSTHPGEKAHPLSTRNGEVPGWKELIETFAGQSLLGGAYQIFRQRFCDDISSRTRLVLIDSNPRFYCFASAWNGTVFSLDPINLVGSEPGVMLLRPDDPKPEFLNQTLISFHESLPSRMEELLQRELFSEWLSYHPEGLKPEECLPVDGAQVPRDAFPTSLSAHWKEIGFQSRLRAERNVRE